jgi:predicted permease
MFERDVKWMSAAIGLLALLVLLVTCTNVSALLTGFATARRHEIAIRLSLGAARSRLIRQLLTESTLLALGSAAAALAIVAGTMHAVRVLIVELPLTPQITWSATSFTIALGITVGMLFGLSPALHATRLAVASVLRDASANLVATRARLQRGLVVAQIAFTQQLTVLVAALLVLVVTQLKTSPRSPMEDRIVIMTAQAPEAASMTNEEQASSESSRLEPARLLEERLAMMPGVVRVARTAPRWPAGVRIGGYTTEAGAVLAGGAQKVAALSAQPVHPEYFAAFDVPVLRGRTFSSEDEALFSGSRTAPAVIDQALAQHLWPDADPLGAVLRPATDTASNAPSLIIIGVVDDPAARRGVDKVDHFVYLPAGAADYGGFVLRTAAPAAPLLPGIRAVIQEIAPATVMGVTTLEAIADGHERNFRMAAGGVSAAGLVALLLAALGLYAVVAFSVGQRTREIAVRVALGGHRRQIVAHFVADGLRLTAIGLLIGLPISLVGLRALISAMGDAPELSLSAVTAIAALGVLTIAAAAAWLPARHAANVDPAVTLRSD